LSGDLKKGKSEPNKSSIRVVLLLVLISTCFHTSWVIYRLYDNPKKALLPDSSSYLRPTRALLYDHAFSVRPGLNRPEFFRTPGYPLFLTGIFAIFSENLLAVCIIQAILSAGTVALIYLIGVRLWSATAGWLAAVLVLLEPLQLIYTATILTECLHAFLLSAMALIGLFIFMERRSQIRHSLALGNTLAFAILVRPGTYYLPVVILMLLLVHFWNKRKGWKSVLFPVLAFLGPLLLLVGGWKVRNHYAVDSWRLTSVDSYSIYMVRAAGVVADIEGISFHKAHVMLQQKLGAKAKNESEGAYYERMRAEGLRIIRKHPEKIIPMTIQGMGQFLGGVPYILSWLRVDKNAFTVAAARAALWIFYFCVIVGGITSLRMGHGLAHIFLISIPLYVALISSPSPQCFVRYRAPVTPILCLYAAAGLMYLFSTWKQRTSSLKSEKSGNSFIGA